jgi:putative membrane protein
MVHFGVGLFMAYPVRESLPRLARTRASWSFLLPIAIILAISALWEIFEVYYGIGLHGAAGYVGTEGDPFDAQHDMAASLAGAVVVMTITAVCRRLPAFA